MADTSRDEYIEVVYNQEDRPFSPYPDKLVRYLVERYDLQDGQKVLDMGCGRGEFLRGFVRCGLQGHGVDQSDYATKLCPEADIRLANLANDPLPFESESLDVVFSKSVLEHFYYPENVIEEMMRVLKPGGLTITLVPDWEVVYRMFYEDYTHRTPFTKTSLNDIFLIHGFEHVVCEKFRQLPFLWRNRWLWPITSIIAFIGPGFMKKHSKLIRFSKEMMLLCSALKPKVT